MGTKSFSNWRDDEQIKDTPRQDCYEEAEAALAAESKTDKEQFRGYAIRRL